MCVVVSDVGIKGGVAVVVWCLLCVVCRVLLRLFAICCGVLLLVVCCCLFCAVVY